MRVCILTANLGGIDTIQEPVQQTVEHDFHCFTDENFPPIAGLTPRLQYRIPKTHGWQMKPGYDLYLWLDGSISLIREDSLKWLIDQLGKNDMALFEHPDRGSAREESDYIEKRKDHPYIKSRYENGLHKQQLKAIEATDYLDDKLYASTVFLYRNTPAVHRMMEDWLYTSIRYFTCDQIALPYLCWEYRLDVTPIDANPFKNPYLEVVSKHK